VDRNAFPHSDKIECVEAAKEREEAGAEIGKGPEVEIVREAKGLGVEVEKEGGKREKDVKVVGMVVMDFRSKKNLLTMATMISLEAMIIKE